MTDVVKSPLQVARSRLDGTYEIDPWGYDRDLVDLLDPFLAVGFRVEVVGAERIPVGGPVALVTNRRVGVSEPLALGRGIRRATGRRVRFLGIPDVAPAGPALRRLGGAVGRPEEMGSLLRAGHTVALPLGRRLWPRRVAGTLAPEALAPALREGAAIVPVAIVGRELLPWWRLIVAEPVPLPDSTGPLALAELADRAQAAVQELLDEAFPPRWLLG